MSSYFDKFVQKGNEFLNEVAYELGTPNDQKRAIRVTKGVLHALRNRITPQESLQMLSQLPLYVKAIYVDGWKLTTRDAKIRHLDDFLALVKEEVGVTRDHDFQNPQAVEDAVKAVFRVLQRHVSAGEIDDIKHSLPTELSALFE